MISLSTFEYPPVIIGNLDTDWVLSCQNHASNVSNEVTEKTRRNKPRFLLVQVSETYNHSGLALHGLSEYYRKNPYPVAVMELFRNLETFLCLRLHVGDNFIVHDMI